RGIFSDSACAGILTAAAALDSLDVAEATPVRITTLEALEARGPREVLSPFAAREDDIAFIQYTSGSVGTPKGVLITHANLNANVRMMSVNRADAMRGFVCWVPHFHDMGLVGNFYLAMHTGASLHLTSANTFVRRPLSWLRLISATRATFTTVPHFALGLCTRLAHTLTEGDIDLSSLRLIVNSSEPVDWYGVEAFERAFAPFGLAEGTVVPHYGLAECTVMVSYPHAGRRRYLDVDREQFARGRIVPQTQGGTSYRIVNNGQGQCDCAIAIVDRETLQACPPDRIGEVWVAGSHVARGYWDGPIATAKVFDQRIGEEPMGRPYVRTGDLGFVHEGDLYVTGRLKDVIIVRGQNYYARDIERIAEQASEMIREGRVVAVPIKHRDTEAVALIAEVSPRFDYREHAASFIGAFTRRLDERLGLACKTVSLLRKNTLPRTTSGKIRRSEAAERFRAAELPVVFQYEAASFSVNTCEASAYPGLASRVALRAWLVSMILEQAGVDAVSDDEDVFALGIDSLSMTNLLLEIEEVTGRSLLNEAFYASPTLNALVDVLMRGEVAEGRSETQSGEAPHEPPARPARTIKKRIAWQLRDIGPSLGPFALSYGTGSRLLDRLVRSPSALERLSRPFAAQLDALMNGQSFADPELVRQTFAKGYCWTGWRERCLSDPQVFKRFVTVEGFEQVEQARARGQGVILALVHTRFKGLYKFIPGLADAGLSAIGNIPADRAAFYGLGAVAAASGAQGGTLVPSARIAQIHNAHRALAAGGTLMIFMDYSDGVGGIELSVLGRKRPVRPGIAEMALDTNALVIPVSNGSAIMDRSPSHSTKLLRRAGTIARKKSSASWHSRVPALRRCGGQTPLRWMPRRCAIN
ncbi:MAG: AMP-binding protein, partial [Pseudomonadota bacterium]